MHTDGVRCTVQIARGVRLAAGGLSPLRAESQRTREGGIGAAVAYVRLGRRGRPCVSNGHKSNGGRTPFLQGLLRMCTAYATRTRDKCACIRVYMGYTWNAFETTPFSFDARKEMRMYNGPKTLMP